MDRISADICSVTAGGKKTKPKLAFAQGIRLTAVIVAADTRWDLCVRSCL